MIKKKPGNYWSPNKPSGPTAHALENTMHPKLYATYPEPNNENPNNGNYNCFLAGSHVIKATIPAGSIIYQGIASEQYGFQGGAQQIWIDDNTQRKLKVDDQQTLEQFMSNNTPNKSGSGGGSSVGFSSNVNQNGLAESYNSSNPGNQIAGNGEADIGGVAVYDPNAIAINLHNSLYDLTADGYYLAFPFNIDKAPFSNNDLQKIISFSFL